MKTATRTAIVLMAAALLAISPYSVLAEGVQPPAPVYAWEDGKLSVQVKDVDIKDVVAGISKATGIEIKIYDEVEGKITYKGEKDPVEKVIDQVLRSIGQKNYVMAQEGGETRKIWILPKGKEIKDADARGRMKVKGKLRNGKEIEYYPGEVVICLDGRYKNLFSIVDMIDWLENKYEIKFIKTNKIGSNDILLFRLLSCYNVINLINVINDNINNRNVEDFIYGNKKNQELFIRFASPNGISDKNTEYPDKDSLIITQAGQEENILMRLNPFLKKDRISNDSDKIGRFVEGVYSIDVHSEDINKITYDDVLFACNKLGLIIIDHVKTYIAEHYEIYYPYINEKNDYLVIIKEIQGCILIGQYSKYTGIYLTPWMI